MYGTFILGILLGAFMIISVIVEEGRVVSFDDNVYQCKLIAIVEESKK